MLAHASRAALRVTLDPALPCFLPKTTSSIPHSPPPSPHTDLEFKVLCFLYLIRFLSHFYKHVQCLLYAWHMLGAKVNLTLLSHPSIWRRRKEHSPFIQFSVFHIGQPQAHRTPEGV